MATGEHVYAAMPFVGKILLPVLFFVAVEVAVGGVGRVNAANHARAAGTVRGDASLFFEFLVRGQEAAIVPELENARKRETRGSTFLYATDAVGPVWTLPSETTETPKAIGAKCVVISIR